MPSRSPKRLAAGLVVALLVAAMWALPSSAAVDPGFCSTPVPSVGEAPPAFKARLGIDRKTVRPGGKVRFRIENLGAEAVEYGYPYGLSRWKEGRWVHLPTGAFILPALYLQPETASRCQVIQIDEDAAAGTYRILKDVSSTQPGTRATVWLRATFRVL